MRIISIRFQPFKNTNSKGLEVGSSVATYGPGDQSRYRAAPAAATQEGSRGIAESARLNRGERGRDRQRVVYRDGIKKHAYARPCKPSLVSRLFTAQSFRKVQRPACLRLALVARTCIMHARVYVLRGVACKRSLQSNIRLLTQEYFVITSFFQNV